MIFFNLETQHTPTGVTFPNFCHQFVMNLYFISHHQNGFFKNNSQNNLQKSTISFLFNIPTHFEPEITYIHKPQNPDQSPPNYFRFPKYSPAQIPPLSLLPELDIIKSTFDGLQYPDFTVDLGLPDGLQNFDHHVFVPLAVHCLEHHRILPLPQWTLQFVPVTRALY